jgi:di/tricarboxylate transporter
VIFIRRDARSSSRFTILRVTIFFFAAGLWLAGVSIGDDRITAAAIGVAVLGLLLGLVARRRAAEPADGEE